MSEMTRSSDASEPSGSSGCVVDHEMLRRAMCSGVDVADVLGCSGVSFATSGAVWHDEDRDSANPLSHLGRLRSAVLRQAATFGAYRHRHESCWVRFDTFIASGLLYVVVLTAAEWVLAWELVSNGQQNADLAAAVTLVAATVVAVALSRGLVLYTGDVDVARLARAYGHTQIVTPELLVQSLPQSIKKDVPPAFWRGFESAREAG